MNQACVMSLASFKGNAGCQMALHSLRTATLVFTAHELRTCNKFVLKGGFRAFIRFCVCPPSCYAPHDSRRRFLHQVLLPEWQQ